MRSEMENRSWKLEFDNLAELINFGEAQPSENAPNASRRNEYEQNLRSSRFGYGDNNFWSGTRDWPEAVKLALEGWPEGEAQARKFYGNVISKLGSMIEQPRYLYDVEGSEFDVARVINSEPESWIQEYREFADAPGRVIKIVYNISVSAGVPATSIMARGAVATALVYLLEQAGKTVELVVREDTKGERGYSSHMSVCVKRAGQFLCPGEVAFALSHPAMLRRVLFAAMERGPKAIIDNIAHQGYGHPASSAQEDQGDLYFDKMYYLDPNFSTPEAAENWIIAELGRHGVKIGK